MESADAVLEEYEGTMHAMLYPQLRGYASVVSEVVAFHVWNIPAPTAASVIQGRADAGNGTGQEQEEEEGGSVQGSLEGSAVRAGTDLDAESSVKSFMSPTLGQHLPPYDLREPQYVLFILGSHTPV